MRRTLLTLALCAALPSLVHAADTGALVEHLYHHTYLVRPAQLTCLPDGTCYPTIGHGRLVYDEGMQDRLVLRCEDDGDGCQYFEQEREADETDEQFAPKPLRWTTEEQAGDEHPV